MIDAALEYICSQLNQSLKNAFDLQEDIAVVSNIVDQDGSVVTQASNKLVITLVNLEKESAAARKMPAVAPTSNLVAITPPSLHLNLYVMFAANFGGGNYNESLKFISNTVSFFQSHPVFDRHTSPGMDARIDKLILDIENLGVHDLSNLWGILSGKYLPSVLYKVRMLTIDTGDLTHQVTRATEPQPRVGAKRGEV